MHNYKIPIEIVEQIVYDYLEELVKEKREVIAKYQHGTQVNIEANEVISACEDLMDYLQTKGLYKFAEEL